MEKVYTIRAVTKAADNNEFFERVHKVRASTEDIAVNWVRDNARHKGHHIELWRIEDIRQVPHFGRTVTDDI